MSSLSTFLTNGEQANVDVAKVGSVAMADVSLALLMHSETLRRRLGEWVGGDTPPDVGSDADLLLDALCGAPAEAYLPRFEASARTLAEQGGRLETRLAGLHRWSAALAQTIDDIFADEPETLAQAHELLGSLIGQIAVTLTQGFQNVKSYQEALDAERSRRGASRLRALGRINAAANSTLDIDQTLLTTTLAVAEEMDAALCSIFLFDEITRELQLRATNGPLPALGAHYTLLIGQGYTGWVAEHGRPLLVADALADNRADDEASAYPQPMRGLLSVPIIFFTSGKLEGALSVQTREPRAFTEDDITFLEIVAGQLAMSIENGRIYEASDEELRRKVHELSTLHRVSALVASSLVLDNVLRMIVEQAVLLSGADRSVLFELEPRTQRLRAVATHGFEDGAAALAGIRAGLCCAGRVVQTGEPSMNVDCMRNDEGCFLHGRPDAIGDQHAALCTPLITVHGPLGALCVFSSQRHMLNTHQLQLVMTFANVAAIAMENARLFEETRQGLRAQEALVREMHHRVKNNLQQVASILNLQRHRTTAPEVEQILGESIDRIQGIAATHDLLSKTQLGVAAVDEIARKIVGITRSNTAPPELQIRFRIGSAPYSVLSDEATTLAIILNELVANAIEHGFAGRDKGTINISGAREGDRIIVRVADDGQGLPPGFSIQAGGNLGLQLVRGLASSALRGSFTLYQAVGDPTLSSHNPAHTARERLTDPLLPALPPAVRAQSEATTATDAPSASAESSATNWTIAEITFSVSLLATTTPEDALQEMVSAFD